MISLPMHLLLSLSLLWRIIFLLGSYFPALLRCIQQKEGEMNSHSFGFLPVRDVLHKNRLMAKSQGQNLHFRHAAHYRSSEARFSELRQLDEIIWFQWKFLTCSLYPGMHKGWTVISRNIFEFGHLHYVSRLLFCNTTDEPCIACIKVILFHYSALLPKILQNFKSFRILTENDISS